MITGDYDYLKAIADNNVCAKHKTPLEVAWYQKQWCLRCGGDGGHYPDAVTRQLSLTQEYKRGAAMPEPIKSNIEKGARRRAMQDKGGQVSPESALLPTTDLGTGNSLTQVQVDSLITYAKKYDLDPYRGHVVLMYGKPYVTIDGYVFHAALAPKAYSLNSRPLTMEERKTYQVEEGNYAWVAEVYFPATGTTLNGLGIVTQDEMTAMSEKHPEQLKAPVVAAHPWLMAQKRAEWQALRRAFPIGETPADE